MNNDQYSNMMVAIAKLEAKIEKLEEMLKPYAVENTVKIQQAVLPEHLSNFWNEERVQGFNNINLSTDGNVTIKANSFDFTPHCGCDKDIKVSLE